MCSCSPKDEARRTLDDAKSLAEQGDYEGALAKYVWFHDHALTVNPAYYGVRLSFALSYWIELGKRYPAALDKLKTIRDEKTSRLLTDDANRELFNDVASINQYLGESGATVELFKMIEAANPSFAGGIYDLADEALLQECEYALAKKYLGDPAIRLTTARQKFEEGLEYSKANKANKVSRQAFEHIFTDEVVQIITVLKATGDEAIVKDLQAEALKTLDNDAIRKAFGL